jgi:hypothetical protein
VCVRPYRRLRGWHGALLFAAGVELVASRAAADEEAVRVVYTAPASCPGEKMFVAQLRTRTQHGRFADSGELARTFDVALSESPQRAGFAGQIEFIDLDGERARRNVSGATCAEVVSSLALIMALSIDDRVAQAEARDSSPSPSPRPAAPREPPKKATPSPAASRSDARAELGAAPRRLRWDVGADAGLATWYAPDASFVYGVFVELGSRSSGPSLRLSGFDTRETKSSDLGTEHVALDSLRLDVCPVALFIAAHVSLSPCAAFDGGVLSATGHGPAINSGTSKKFWSSGAALLRLGWAFKERLAFGLDAELGAPLIQYQLQFANPDIALPSEPAVGVGAKAGVALRFP